MNGAEAKEMRGLRDSNEALKKNLKEAKQREEELQRKVSQLSSSGAVPKEEHERLLKEQREHMERQLEDETLGHEREKRYRMALVDISGAEIKVDTSRTIEGSKVHHFDVLLPVLNTGDWPRIAVDSYMESQKLVDEHLKERTAAIERAELLSAELVTVKDKLQKAEKVIKDGDLTGKEQRLQNKQKQVDEANRRCNAAEVAAARAEGETKRRDKALMETQFAMAKLRQERRVALHSYALEAIKPFIDFLAKLPLDAAQTGLHNEQVKLIVSQAVQVLLIAQENELHSIFRTTQCGQFDPRDTAHRCERVGSHNGDHEQYIVQPKLDKDGNEVYAHKDDEDPIEEIVDTIRWPQVRKPCSRVHPKTQHLICQLESGHDVEGGPAHFCITKAFSGENEVPRAFMWNSPKKPAEGVEAFKAPMVIEDLQERINAPDGEGIIQIVDMEKLLGDEFAQRNLMSLNAVRNSLNLPVFTIEEYKEKIKNVPSLDPLQSEMMVIPGTEGAIKPSRVSLPVRTFFAMSNAGITQALIEAGLLSEGDISVQGEAVPLPEPKPVEPPVDNVRELPVKKSKPRSPPKGKAKAPKKGE